LPDRFLVWGAGGHGRVVADVLRQLGHRVDAFVDRAPASGALPPVAGVRTPVISEDELQARLDRGGLAAGGGVALALGVGDNRVREAQRARLEGCDLPPIVAAAAVVSTGARVGRGTVIMPGAIVNVGARVGAAVIVNSGAIVEHDCVVDDAAHLSPGAVLCGGVRVGARAWVGANATLVPGVEVGEDAIVGAGAVVLADVPAGTTVVGNPARPLLVAT